MNARSVLALIPARGGSKSVPRKNVLPIAGRPLIAYSIDQALQSAYVTRTIVSTDDEEIAEIASHAGAEVPFLRPPQLATDTATDNSRPIPNHRIQPRRRSPTGRPGSGRGTRSSSSFTAHLRRRRRR